MVLTSTGPSGTGSGSRALLYWCVSSTRAASTELSRSATSAERTPSAMTDGAASVASRPSASRAACLGRVSVPWASERSVVAAPFEPSSPSAKAAAARATLPASIDRATSDSSVELFFS